MGEYQTTELLDKHEHFGFCLRVVFEISINKITVYNYYHNPMTQHRLFDNLL